jgi:hypothetical protein
MAIVKTQSIAAFVAAIGAAVPELAGKITVHQEPPATIETFPNLAVVLSGRLSFDPSQEDVFADLGDNVVVFNVGAFEGPMQLRLTAATIRERSVLCEKIEQWMMSREGSPGIQVVQVIDSEHPDTLSWVAAFAMDDEMWDDSGALMRTYEAIATLDVTLPALVTRSPVYTIDTLILGTTGDFITAFTPDTFGPPDVELVVINQDGSISPA